MATRRIESSWFHAIVPVLVGAASGCGFIQNAQAQLTFTQTVDGWFTNTFTWPAQVQPLTLKRNFDPVGTVSDVWGRVVQVDGSQVGTPVFCTTMTKAAAGLVDTWNVNVPAGTITDGDWWDATQLTFEFADCERGHKRISYTDPLPLGPVPMTDYAAIPLAEDLTTRHLEIDGAAWDHAMVSAMGFDFTLIAYATPGGPIPLVDLDPLGLTTLRYEAGDTFGTGQPMDYSSVRFILIDLDPAWDLMPTFSNGLNNVVLDLPAGKMFTDQGVFDILRAQPLPTTAQIICNADYNRDGIVDILDFLQFFDDFGNQVPAADYNLDGLVDILDFLDFINDFGNGCP